MGTRFVQETRSRAGEGAGAAFQLTAGDLARLLDVDLKTIHNWVKQGHVSAHRTEGRHLRFERVQVVRFLRRFGHPVPSRLGKVPARVLLHQGRPGRAGLSGIDATWRDGLLAATLEVARGRYEVMVLELDAHERALTREFVGAIRECPSTRGLGLVGLSSGSGRRREFLACGGDVAIVNQASAIVGTVRWLTGATPVLPRGALATDALAAFRR